ncbi:MAG TPA: arsenite methyltransferase [Cyclobacteriaceae bacterium]|jgi:arsenite methyltransferase|nr:arsenite methyltransferase [Cyclobacteriaceae bacterium]PZN54979.1 MAG: arsenite S-adenosylmethyltransferase [Bacteroidota bacterium]
MNKQSETPEQLKELVKEKYAQIADQAKTDAAGCCGPACCDTIDQALMVEDYSKLSGYVADADLGLGCGLPTQFAKISEGDTVVDLGSGAGNDCFVARSLTGERGKVIGVDFTEKMVEKARLNATKLGLNNVEFRLGDIENLPLAAETADVVVSNCVLNLVPNKRKAFEETYRVLKKGGHFSISDIVLEGELPDELRKAAEMYAGCVSGAIQKEEYLDIVGKAGFANVTVQKEKEIILPDDILLTYLAKDEIPAFRSKARILSITVYGEKTEEKSGCCSPECCS